MLKVYVNMKNKFPLSGIMGEGRNDSVLSLKKGKL